MNSIIYNPLEEFESKYKAKHSENTNQFFDKLVRQSGIDIEKNRETVRLYNEYKENLAKMKRRLFWWKVLRVLMCITILLIPIVIWKITPKIRALKTDIEEADKRVEELLAEANNQMLPLNQLFTDRDALDIIESTIPLLSFEKRFSVKQEADMKINYDFCESNEDEQSTIDVLAGNYNENPFFLKTSWYIRWERKPITAIKPLVGPRPIVIPKADYRPGPGHRHFMLRLPSQSLSIIPRWYSTIVLRAVRS